MKYLYHTLLFAFFLYTMCSCSDDEVQAKEELRIVQSEVAFDAQGGVGLIQVESPSTFSVQSNAYWCEAKINNSIIEVNVSENEESEGRNALITISDSQKKIHVPVTQAGKYLTKEFEDFVTFGNNAGKKNIPIHYSGELNVKYEVDWLNVQVGQNSLEMSVTKNTTNKIRRADIFIENGNIRDTIVVQQGELSNLLGKYTLVGRQLGKEFYWMLYKQYEDSFPVELAKDKNNKYWINFVGYNFGIPVEVDESKLKLTVFGGSKMGTVNLWMYGFNGTLFAAVANYNGGYSTESSVSMNFQFTNEDGKTIAYYQDNGSYGHSIKMNSIYFYAYVDAASPGADIDSMEEHEDGAVGAWGYVQEPRLIKVE